MECLWKGHWLLHKLCIKFHQNYSLYLYLLLWPAETKKGYDYLLMMMMMINWRLTNRSPDRVVVGKCREWMHLCKMLEHKSHFISRSLSMIDRPGERSADSVTVNNNSPIQDCVHPDDHTQPNYECSYVYFLHWNESSEMQAPVVTSLRLISRIKDSPTLFFNFWRRPGSRRKHPSTLLGRPP